jgi:high frequency lysogenization protein
MNLIEERTIALAGIFQACQQVQALARTGMADQAAFDSSLQSVLILDAVNTAAVFGGVEGVRSGMSLIVDGVMNSPQGEKVELLRYAMSLMHLQGQLYNDEVAFAEFGQAVERLSAVPKDNLVGACSELYQKFISDMRPQIIVQGEQNYLRRKCERYC